MGFELLSSDMEFTDLASGVTTHGGDAFVDYGRGWAGAFSDMKLELMAVVADDSRVAGEFVARGTHDGTLPMPTGEIGATGKSIEVRFIWFADVAGGRITAMRDYYDGMTIMVQLGLMPEPSQAAG